MPIPDEHFNVFGICCELKLASCWCAIGIVGIAALASVRVAKILIDL